MRFEELERHHDRSEHVVDVVSDPAGETAERLDALGAPKQHFPLGHVGIDDEDGSGIVQVVLHECPPALYDDVCARPRALVQLAGPLPLGQHGLEGVRMPRIDRGDQKVTHVAPVAPRTVPAIEAARRLWFQ